MERAELYRLWERNDAGITVMKPYAGGRLFDAERCPFGAKAAGRMARAAELFKG